MLVGYQQPLSGALEIIAIAVLPGAISLLIVLDVGGVTTQLGHEWAARYRRAPFKYLPVLPNWQEAALDPRRQRRRLQLGAGGVLACCVAILILEAVAIVVNGLR